jgi:hypothetical protein
LCLILIVLNYNTLYIVHKLQIDNGLQTKFGNENVSKQKR